MHIWRKGAHVRSQSLHPKDLVGNSVSPGTSSQVNRNTAGSAYREPQGGGACWPWRRPGRRNPLGSLDVESSWTVHSRLHFSFRSCVVPRTSSVSWRRRTPQEPVEEVLCFLSLRKLCSGEERQSDRIARVTWEIRSVLFPFSPPFWRENSK